MRNLWRRFDYQAECKDCGWRSDARNALANAAQHHDRTGHTVAVDVSGHVCYASDAEDAKRCEQRGIAR